MRRRVGFAATFPPQKTPAAKRREALLAALLLGDRGSGLDGLDKAFRRIGLAHLLSISGLHLSIFVVTGLVFVRFTQAPPWVERLAMMVLVLGYLFLVPARVPVWRAGVMLLTFLAAGMSGRRLNSVNVLAIAASIVLLWRPSDLFSPGFQLSFGVVYGLMVLTVPLRKKWFGEPRDIELISIPEMIWEWLKTAIAGASVAWLVSLPLIAHHFGMVCALAMPMTLLALPLAWIILGLGYFKALTAVLWPSVGVILGHPIALGTDALIGLVQWADEVPLSTMNIAFPGVVWMVLALGAVVVWCAHDWRENRRARRVAQILTVLLAIWPLAIPSLRQWSPGRPAARITMIAVGSGSCYVLECGGETILFDAGSGSFFGVGDRTIIPALRRMGITRVPTIILSHADVDHFAGAIEVIESMNTRRLIVPPHMLEQQRVDPYGPVALLLQEADRHGVSIEIAKMGTTRALGTGTLTWLHPDETEAHYRTDNDRSAVIRFDVAGRRVLLTGDIQTAAIAHLFEKGMEPLHADILEMPHHGGWSEASLEFVRATNARILFQSTGASRIRNDRWPEHLEGRRRFISVRDGATSITISPEGEIEVTTFRKP